MANTTTDNETKIYSWYLEVDDDAEWKEKINIFKVFYPLLKDTKENESLVNKDEIKKAMRDCFIEELDTHLAKKRKTINEQFHFLANKDIFERFLYKDLCLETIKKLLDAGELKLAFDLAYTCTRMPDMDAEVTIEDLKKLLDGTVQGFEIESAKDIAFINTLSEPNYTNSDSSAEYRSADVTDTFIGLLQRQGDISDSTIDVMTKGEIINMVTMEALFDKSFIGNVGDDIMDVINTHEDSIKHLFTSIFAAKCSIKDNRKRVINILEKNKNSEAGYMSVMMKYLNDVLLDENAPNVIDIKTEWMQTSLETQAGNIDDDDDDDSLV